MELSTILNPIACLFILMAVGYLCGKRRLFSESFIHDLTTLLMEVSLPCMVFRSMLQEVRPELIQESLWIFVATLIFATICGVLSLAVAAFCRWPERKRRFWAFAATYSNNGFMGYPVVYALFGSEGLFLAAISSAAMVVHVYTLGVIVLNRKQQGLPKQGLRQTLYSNINIALVLGIICFFVQPTLPDIVTDCLGFFGDMTTPLSMMIVGLYMARYSLRQAITDIAAWSSTAMRLIVMPLLALVLVRLFAPVGYVLPSQVFVVLAAMPVAVIAVVFGEQFNGPTDFTTNTVVISTLMCIITIPLFLLII